MSKNDPLGQAILDFSQHGKAKDIIVASDLCDDDVIPVDYLFRSYSEMPKMEQVALAHCKGKILDVGSGSGIHANYLKDQGKDVSCIDISPAAIEYAKTLGLDARQRNFFDLSGESYDTLLFMMNGIGIAGTLANLDKTLIHAKTLLNPGGQLLCDSTDIKYLYEDEDGGMWVDLNTEYYGNFRFQMKYGEHESEWFDWLYVDSESLEKSATKCGFHFEILVEEETQFLAKLTLIV